MIKQILAFFLRLVNPHKPLGTALFDAIAKVSVSVAFEAVALRKNPETDAVEVFLIQRAENDTAYPGEWHVPGSVLRPQEAAEHVLIRLSKREFGTKVVKSKFVAILSNPGEARGHFISLVYRVKLDGEPVGRGKWFPVDALPAKTVTEHRKHIIPIAVGEKTFEDLDSAKVKTLGV